jgi:DNA-directed RNA polymerase specialized sigma24 family protein
MNTPHGDVVGLPGSLDRPDDSENAVIDLYRTHVLGLTRLAIVMLGDRATAEDVVQDAFCGLYTHWRRLSDPAKALPYLRSSVLNGCRNHRGWSSRARTAR